MKNLILFFINFILFLFMNNKLVDTCETGSATTYETENLVERFAKEYSSKRNALWNMVTGNWFYHLKDLDDSQLYNLCECVFTKLQPNDTNVVKGIRITTTTECNIDFSFNNTTIRNIPLLECSANKQGFYLIEGYRSNGLKLNAYDVYAFRTRKFPPNQSFSKPEFIGVVNTVDFHTIGKLNDVVFIGLEQN